MNWKKSSLQSRLYLVAAMVLLAGLGSSILIYLTARDDSDNMMIYEFEHSKMYRHDLELYGGKINVLASEFMRWFEGLWHGKSLAVTVSCITLAISLCLLFVAYHLPPGPESRDHKDESDIKEQQ